MLGLGVGLFVVAFAVATVALLEWVDEDGALAVYRAAYDDVGVKAVVAVPLVVWLCVLLAFSMRTPRRTERGDPEA